MSLFDNYNLPIKAIEEIDGVWCDKFKEGYANRKINTPGHTPGHICLFLRESGILVSGDAINITDGKPSGPNPQHTYDMELGKKSMEKAMKYPVKAMVSYHCGYLKIMQ